MDEATVALALAGMRASSRDPPRARTRVQLSSRRIAFFIAAAGATGVVESVLRKHFGNSADVSKGLRLLVKADAVFRRGQGGRADPFVYYCAL